MSKSRIFVKDLTSTSIVCADPGKIGSESKQSKPKYSRKIIFYGTTIAIAIVAILVFKLIVCERPEGGYANSFYIFKM